jgi:thiol-disulfide isomerase/thioredoxin
MIRLVFSLLLLPFLSMAQDVQITPRFPQRGEQVTVSWQPDPGQLAPHAPVSMIFTYSNLYELPLKINLQPAGSSWKTSFVLPRYATFATFYLQAGDKKITPAAGGHYELAVYKADGTPVKNGYLYKSYSLSAQWGRSAHLAADQAALYHKELTVYPDNYEARIRLYQYEISQAPPAVQDSLRQQAHAVIAAKFESDPTAMGNLNYVTMGYLILGENSRLDSIRKVVMDRFPHLPIGKELMVDVIRKEKDTAKMVARLEQELKEETPAGRDAYAAMHEILFDYYAAHGDSARALLHASGMLPERSPYLPEVLLDVTRTLTEAHLAPDAALDYAVRSLQSADSTPAGLIRYFPETGYIPSYVSDSVRKVAVAKAKGNALALMGRIYADKGDKVHALQMTDNALAVSADGKTLQYAAMAYEKLAAYEKAYTTHRQWMIGAGTVDTAAVRAMKDNYRLSKGSANGWEKAYAAFLAERRDKLMEALRVQQLHAKGPSLDSIVDLTGKPVLPSSLKGKVVVIDFWATWCVPCMEEMPYLQKVYEVYKNDPRVVFMVINSGAKNTLKDAQNWFGNKKYSFPVYFHTNPNVGDVFGFNVIPAVFVIDGEGKLQFRTIGFEGEGMEEKLKAEIGVALGKG